MIFDPEDDVVSDSVKVALESAWQLDVPPLASALHARWWQLETWLRSLCYVELKSRFGERWIEKLPSETEKRHARDLSSYRYMPSPDADDRLAHLDVGQLFPVIEDHWELFEPSLLDLPAWNGRLSELNKIRRQIAHCRRPHRDDLARLEQTLRDLDGGAFRALASYNRLASPDDDLKDSVVQAWQRGKHASAHLIEHADRQYDTRFLLQYSRRPWATPRLDGSPVSGSVGYLWGASDLSGVWVA